MVDLVIDHVTLIDGAGTPPLPDAFVAITGHGVTAVGQGVPPPADHVIDGSGRWAVPGLIDTHVHVELVGSECLALWLALGVTTVRDLGGSLEFLVEARRQLDNGLTGARLLFTGPMIDGDPPTWPALNLAAGTDEAAIAAIDQDMAAGADAIKLYTTLPPERLKCCIEHVAGRVPVTGHLGLTPASFAMEAGINGLEHALLTPYSDLAPEDMPVAAGETMVTPGFWSKVTLGWTKADLQSDRAKRWIEQLVERDVSLCPTLTVVPGAGDEPGAGELERAPRVAERWIEATQQRQAVEVPAEYQRIARDARAKLQELVLRVHEAGGRVVAGTDTGAIRSLVPGYSLHRELRFLSDAGLSCMDVLRTATARAAEALWRDDLGSIAPGKRADMLLLRSDPLVDVGALRDIELVVHDGVAHQPDTLLATNSG